MTSLMFFMYSVVFLLNFSLNLFTLKIGFTVHIITIFKIYKHLLNINTLRPSCTVEWLNGDQ